MAGATWRAARWSGSTSPEGRRVRRRGNDVFDVHASPAPASLRRARPPFLVSVLRGIGGRCPNCGESALFRAYLKQVDACPVCGEKWGNIRADDAPPWLTILVVGHIIIPAAMAVESRDLLPFWASMTLWPVLALALSLLILPRAKGAFIATIWQTRAHGSEQP
ncbi:MAG: DUF983 domain-containing protein [Rhodospirillales bacterium]|nr:DUF983 domain-containing protein [Rhodospirillales bacterium]